MFIACTNASDGKRAMIAVAHIRGIVETDRGTTMIYTDEHDFHVAQPYNKVATWLLEAR